MCDYIFIISQLFYNLMIINIPVRIDYCEVGYRDDGIVQLSTVCEFAVYSIFYFSTFVEMGNYFIGTNRSIIISHQCISQRIKK